MAVMFTKLFMGFQALTLTSRNMRLEVVSFLMNNPIIDAVHVIGLDFKNPSSVGQNDGNSCKYAMPDVSLT
jgi:hypothetical protein